MLKALVKAKSFVQAEMVIPNRALTLFGTSKTQSCLRVPPEYCSFPQGLAENQQCKINTRHAPYLSQEVTFDEYGTVSTFPKASMIPEDIHSFLFEMK